MATQPDVTDPSSIFKNEERFKKYIQELKSYATPPKGIKVTMDAVTVLFGKDQSWATAKKMLADFNFLNMIKNFDKDNINPEDMAKVRRDYIDNPDITPEKMKNSSLACYLLYKWIITIDKYDRDRTTKGQEETGKE